eukprot:2411543-Prymnesium_polylepis.1
MQRRTHAPSTSPPSTTRRRFGLSATTSFMASAWHVSSRHLQLDRRCPVCRKAPRTAIDDQEDDADAAQDMIDASE